MIGRFCCITLNIISMKKILNLSWLLFAVIVITSCSDNDLPTSVPAVKDYQTDAQILGKFVDVNKTLGEYYINENKKNSPMSYITDKEYQEFLEVNPVNRTKFENDLTALNAQVASAAKRADVSQIIYSTYNKIWVKELNHNTPFSIKEDKTAITRAPKNTYGRLSIFYNSEQRTSFYAGKQVYTKFDLILNSYIYYFFELICDTKDVKKDPSVGPPTLGGTNEKSIVMSGMALMESHLFVWNYKGGNDKVFWQFRGKRDAPKDFAPQITAEFYD